MATLIPQSERLSHTVAFRLTTTEYLELLPFFEAFDGQASAGLRWLLSQEATQQTMRDALAAVRGG